MRRDLFYVMVMAFECREDQAFMIAGEVWDVYRGYDFDSLDLSVNLAVLEVCGRNLDFLVVFWVVLEEKCGVFPAFLHGKPEDSLHIFLRDHILIN